MMGDERVKHKSLAQEKVSLREKGDITNSIMGLCMYVCVCMHTYVCVHVYVYYV